MNATAAPNTTAPTTPARRLDAAAVTTLVVLGAVTPREVVGTTPVGAGVVALPLMPVGPAVTVVLLLLLGTGRLAPPSTLAKLAQVIRVLLG